MKYLINRETKEHRLMPATIDPVYVDGWDIVEADGDGWIEWSGGGCPLPDGASHEVKFRSGHIQEDERPETWGWSHDGRGDEIIAYRPILDSKPETIPAPDYDPRSVSFNLLERLKAAHQAANELPDLVSQLRAELEPLGLGVTYLSQIGDES